MRDYLIQCSKIEKSAMSNMFFTVSIFSQLHTPKAKNNVLTFNKKCVVRQLHDFHIFLRNFALFLQIVLQILEHCGDVHI